MSQVVRRTLHAYTFTIQRELIKAEKSRYVLGKWGGEIAPRPPRGSATAFRRVILNSYGSTGIVLLEQSSSTTMIRGNTRCNYVSISSRCQEHAEGNVTPSNCDDS